MGRAQTLAAQSKESRLRELYLELTPPLEDRLTLAVWGQSLGVGETGDQRPTGTANAGVGAELRLGDELCDTLVLGAHGRAEAGQGPVLSFETWGSTCLMAGFPLPFYEVGHHLELHVRPALDAAAGLAPGRFNREALQIRFGALDIESNDWRWQFGVVDAEIAFLWGTPYSDLDLALVVDAGFFRMMRPRITSLGRTPFVFALFPAEVRMVKRSRKSLAANVGIVRIRGMELGDGGPYLDVQLGGAFGSIGPRHGSGETRATTTAQTFGGFVTLRGGGERVSAGGTIERIVRPTLLDQLVLDSRGELWGHLSAGPVEARVGGFVAGTLILDPGGGKQTHFTGGGRLQVGHALGADAELAATVEGARSFYARLGGDTDAPPAWLLRAEIALTARFDAEPGTAPSSPGTRATP